MANGKTKRRYVASGKFVREHLAVRRCSCGCNRRFVPTRPKHIYFNRRCAARVAGRNWRAKLPRCEMCGHRISAKAKRNGTRHNGARNGK